MIKIPNVKFDTPNNRENLHCVIANGIDSALAEGLTPVVMWLGQLDRLVDLVTDDQINTALVRELFGEERFQLYVTQVNEWGAQDFKDPKA